jgi:uncharacterized membrane protein YfcA
LAERSPAHNLAASRGCDFPYERRRIGIKGVVSADTIRLLLLGLPALLSGTWLGMKLYGRLDEAMFRRVVLILLLVSGAVLIF